jgi:RloB-like protein
LLHFEDIQAPLHRDEVMNRLKLHIPNYEKGASNAFTVTRRHLTVAISRTQQLAARFSARTDPEPFTDIAELVNLLTTLRD